MLQLAKSQPWLRKGILTEAQDVAIALKYSEGSLPHCYCSKVF